MSRSFPALWGRKSGVLEVSRSVLIFTSDEDSTQVFQLIPHLLQISMGGENSPHFYLKDRNHPEIEICVQDEAILAELASYGLPQAGFFLEKSRKRRTIRNLLLGSPFALALLLLLAIPLLFSFIPISWFNEILTIQQEKKLGEFLIPTIQKEFKVKSNHPAQPALEQLVVFLKEASPELQKFDFQIFVADQSDINAFAIPGGLIVFNQGLLQKAESVEEVLGVLSHEMAHVERRHVVKSLAGRVGALGGVLILAAFVGSDAATVIAKASDFLSLKHSREDESEADARGLEFLQRAGVSSEGMIQFFSKLEKQESSLSGALSFMSTHPLSSERIRDLKQLAAQSSAIEKKPLPVEIGELKSVSY